MYAKYFRFREEPFNLTPDPRFLYMTRQHRDALDHLLYGIGQRKGFILLTGEVGTGKTTLCRALLKELGPSVHTALILNPVMTETQLVRAVVEEFGLVPPRRDRLSHLTALNQFLLKVNAAGQTAVLVIDEAQDLSVGGLEQVRLLSNLETERQKLLQICLLGQPELRRKLAKPALRQLAQRITVRFHLQRMRQDDVGAYLSHRLGLASEDPSAPAVRFQPDAVDEVYSYSQGTPRLVNALCDRALLAGYVYRTGEIDRRLVRLAADELKEACPSA